MLVTRDNFNKCLAAITGQKRLINDTETTGVEIWHGSRIVGISVSTPALCRKRQGFYFPFRHKNKAKNLTVLHWYKLRAVLLATPRHTGWNYQFDMHMYAHDGLEFPLETKTEDVMFAAHLMNENEWKLGRNYKLKDWCRHYIPGEKALTQLELQELMMERGLGMGDMWQLEPEEVEPYAVEDCVLTEAARRFLRPHLREWGLWDMWHEVSEYGCATRDMEKRGLRLDKKRIRTYMREAERMERKAYRKLCKVAGYDINPASPKQLQALLGLKSTAKEVLEALEEDGNQGETVRAVLDHRAWSKVNNTYYQVYLDRCDEEGILHPNINLIGTIAGRPSASNPNLQAVPRYTKIYKVKDVFIARKGYILVSMDYSQAELRLLVHYTRDKLMKRIFMSGGDFHQTVADQLSIERDPAKRINFGVVYGLGVPGLAKRLRIAMKAAAEFLGKYHARFPRISQLRRHMQSVAENQSYIRLWTGRCRHYNYRWSEPHKALSNLIQGGVAEIMRHAICKMRRMFLTQKLMNDCHMLLQVHDQILFEIPDDKLAHKRIAKIKAVMEDFPWLYVPMKVDIKVGRRWGTLKEYKPRPEKTDGRISRAA